jgi:hypothetical protein
MCYGTGMKRRYWIDWALGLLVAVASTGRGADAVVEFYRTQPDAGQYVLHETSLYELRRTIDVEYDRALDSWQRAAEKFAEHPEAVQLCGAWERRLMNTRKGGEKCLERNLGSLTVPGDRVFYFDCYGDDGRDGGKLVLAPDGSIKCRMVEYVLEREWWEKWSWRRQAKARLQSIGERSAELEADTAKAFLRDRSDAASHTLHATSCRGLGYYVAHAGFAYCKPAAIGENLADVPGFQEFAEAEHAATQAWTAPRKAIVEKIKAEADPTDRLYWDVFDDGEHRRAGLLWLRWDGSVRQEWPYFGETTEKE